VPDTDGVTTTVPFDPTAAWAGADTVTDNLGMVVVGVVVEPVAAVARSAVSDKVADVVWAPGVAENITVTVTDPNEVPAVMGVEEVEVQVATVLAPERTHDQLTGAGSEANVPPLGAVTVTTGSAYAGPPDPVIDGVTTTVPVDPATAWAGPEAVTARTGAAVVVVVAESVAGVALSAVSEMVADVVWAPGVEENVMLALIAPRAVPAAMGVAVVEVQVATVLAPERTHDQPAGAGSEAKVPPLGAVTVTAGSP